MGTRELLTFMRAHAHTLPRSTRAAVELRGRRQLAAAVSGAAASHQLTNIFKVVSGRKKHKLVADRGPPKGPASFQDQTKCCIKNCIMQSLFGCDALPAALSAVLLLLVAFRRPQPLEAKGSTSLIERRKYSRNMGKRKTAKKVAAFSQQLSSSFVSLQSVTPFPSL